MLFENEHILSVLKDTGWHLKGRHIFKVIKFEDFSSAVEALNDVANIADELHHEPDIEITENRLKIILTSRDEGGVSDRDIDMANKIDAILD